jgi:hypothetical protein
MRPLAASPFSCSLGLFGSSSQVDWLTAARRRTRGAMTRDSRRSATTASSPKNSGLTVTRCPRRSPPAFETCDRCPPSTYALPPRDSSVSYTALPPRTTVSPPILACESTTAFPTITVASRRTWPLTFKLPKRTKTCPVRSPSTCTEQKRQVALCTCWPAATKMSCPTYARFPGDWPSAPATSRSGRTKLLRARARKMTPWKSNR